MRSPCPQKTDVICPHLYRLLCNRLPICPPPLTSVQLLKSDMHLVLPYRNFSQHSSTNLSFTVSIITTTRQAFLTHSPPNSPHSLLAMPASDTRYDSEKRRCSRGPSPRYRASHGAPYIKNRPLLDSTHYHIRLHLSPIRIPLYIHRYDIITFVPRTVVLI